MLKGQFNIKDKGFTKYTFSYSYILCLLIPFLSVSDMFILKVNIAISVGIMIVNKILVFDIYNMVQLQFNDTFLYF